MNLPERLDKLPDQLATALDLISKWTVFIVQTLLSLGTIGAVLLFVAWQLYELFHALFMAGP